MAWNQSRVDRFTDGTSLTGSPNARRPDNPPQLEMLRPSRFTVNLVRVLMDGKFFLSITASSNLRNHSLGNGDILKTQRVSGEPEIRGTERSLDSGTEAAMARAHCDNLGERGY